jgi:type III pantothenate kinase
MKLLLDIGNTRLKWGWWDHDLKSGGAVVHAGRSPEAVLDAVNLKLLPTEIWAASVAAPALRAAVGDWAQRCCNVTPRWVASTASACGVRCAYAQPEKLGVDRWLSVIAAYHRAGGAACVVDAGTALTLDVVDARGQHLGGLIAPGLGTQRQSLRKETQLRVQEAQDSPTWLASDTDTAVAWGTLHAVIGLIERVLAGIPREQAGLARLLTGGEAEQLLPHLGAGWILAPHLVLEGLARVAQEDAYRVPA